MTRYVESRRARFALGWLAIFGVSALFLQNVSAHGAKLRAVPQVARFYLRGTHGYKVSVVARVEGPGSPVRIVAENRKGAAEYQVDGDVSAGGIHASFGALGRIAMHFHPSGRVLRWFGSGGGCHYGARAKVGTFGGSFRFHGEDGYTVVSTHRVWGGVGSPTAPINHREELQLFCPQADRTYIVPPAEIQQRFTEGSTKESTPSVDVGAFAEGVNEATAFVAVSFSLRHPHEAAAKPDFCLFMAANEETQGRVAIARTVLQGGPVSQCPFDEARETFSVTPEPPFSGTASFQRNPDGSTSWTGPLSVPMLGRGFVALTGPAFTAELLKP